MAAHKSNRKCSIDGCGMTHAAKGLCQKHYMRIYKNGTLELQNSPEPFCDRYEVDEVSGCWNWIRGTDEDGYGKMSLNGKDIRAHRYSWEIKNGSIATDQLVCHSCDNPSCVNPSHLFLGDHSVNHADRGIKDRTANGERAGASRFTEKQISEMREKNLGFQAARQKYGISKTHYYRVLHGDSWRHLNG